jgi:hypothetical protein
MTKLASHILLLVALLSATLIVSENASAQDEEARMALQVVGKVAFGPFEYYAPQGYWYGPGQFSPDDLQKGHAFIVTFRETKDGIDLDPSPSFKVIFNVVIASNNYFKDLASYKDYLERQTEAVSHRKELPETTNDLFKNVSEWYCTENVNLRMVSLDCARVNDYVVLMSAIAFDEKKVLEKAPILAEMIGSFKVSEKRP